MRDLHADLLLVDVHAATMRAGATPYGVVHDAAIAMLDGVIVYAGPRAALPQGLTAAAVLEGGGAWVTPGLIDCHTHLVYAGNRVDEYERRRLGVSYAQIAREGGGIAATVRATRAATDATLAAESLPRLQALAAEGVTTVEVKSGYGLDTAAELKQLRVARMIARDAGVDVRTTLLAAHALPPEFADRADAYIDMVCAQMIPAAVDARLADAVDAYCETIGFTPAQTQRVFDAARAHGLRVKLHADQLSDMGGGAQAAAAGALSADHLEYTSEAGVAAMGAARTVAVLLPGAFYTLRETKLPPIEAMRVHHVAMAVSTDCNPGTSPTTSLLLMLNMACTLFRLTPEEALAGVTAHAARALGLTDRGTITPGTKADLACWDIAAPAELAYRLGGNPNIGVIRDGRVARWRT